MPPDHVDVVVAGGGPAGMTLAAALDGTGFSVLVLEAQTEQRRDARTLALSHGSRLTLEHLGAWACIDTATPIATIHVSQRGRFGVTRLQAGDAGVPALGYVVEYSALHHALSQCMERAGATQLTGAQVTSVVETGSYASVEYLHHGVPRTVTCGLVVAADGGSALAAAAGFTRHRSDYGQDALVAHVRTALPHNNVAYERFTESGPLALLPSGDGFALVLTETPERAEALAALDDAAFLAELQQRFGDRQGRFTATGPRHRFPVSLSWVTPAASGRVAAIGNAAQSLHPVAGQGFNLGLRDARDLAQNLRDAARAQLDASAAVSAYARDRRLDRWSSIAFTHSLVSLFSNDLPLLRETRSTGLAALDLLPPLRRHFARRMIFG